jgi:hypothetical protein
MCSEMTVFCSSLVFTGLVFYRPHLCLCGVPVCCIDLFITFTPNVLNLQEGKYSTFMLRSPNRGLGI